VDVHVLGGDVHQKKLAPVGMDEWRKHIATQLLDRLAQARRARAAARGG